MRAPAVIAIALLAVAWSASAQAQLALTNLVEARVGTNPFRPELPKNRNEIYDLLDLDYTLSSVRLGLRFESYHQGYESQAFEPGYDAITQRYAEWNDDHLRARVGNFYTILGRGLIHRSFQLPGVVLDQTLAPARYSPSRDLDGVIVEGRAGPIAARAFSGRPNSGEYAPSAVKLLPDFELYRGLVSGAQVVGTVWRDSKVGLAYARLSGEGEGQKEFGSTFIEVDPLRLAGIRSVQMPIYAEVARQNADWGREWGIGVADSDTAAVYASANLVWGAATFSAEWKDYRAFRLGSNDPPSLVREHSFYLLNRSTHFLLADREEGYQLEGSYTLPAWGTLTLNSTRADGRSGKPVRFEERYGELHVAPHAWDRFEGTAFWARGKDEFLGASVSDRTIAGTAATVRFLTEWSANVDLEWLEAQRIDFFGRPVAHYRDRYAVVGVSRADWGSLAFVWERSTDPDIEDPDNYDTPNVEPNVFTSVVASARLGERHDATLFAGERRGGPACTAGTCYIVEPFRGVELRLTSRF